MFQSTHANRWVDTCHWWQRRLARGKAGPQVAGMDTPHARLAAARTDYATFLATYLPDWTPTACADFHLKAAARVQAHTGFMGVWQWFRGAAKSTHATLLLPLWLAIQDPPQTHVVLVVGRSLAAARRQLRSVKYALENTTLLLQDAGWQRGKPWNSSELAMAFGPSFLALGQGQSPRGLRIGARRPDFIVCDDIDYPALARNTARVDQAAEWVLEDLLGTQDVGPGRFLLVGNLFSQHSVQARLLATGAFHLHRVDALTADGTPTWPAKYGDGAWLKRRREVLGYRAFAREYMNTPVETGALVRSDWIRYVPDRPWADYSALVAYIDPSFTDSPRADYKACKLWGVLEESGGVQYHQLAAFVRQASLRSLFTWCFELAARGAQQGVVVSFVIEANFFQALVLKELEALEAETGQRLPIRPDTQKKGPKYSRIEAVGTLWERRLVGYPESLRTDSDTQTGIAQLLALAPGSRAHDDGPDADAGALALLLQQKQPLGPAVSLKERLVVGARPKR